MGWWITLGILVLLAVLPLGVAVRYDEDGAAVRIIAGPVKITLFPRPKKKKKPKKEKKPKEKKTKTKKAPPKSAGAQSSTPAPAPVTTEEKAPAKKAKPEKKAQKGGSVTDFLPLVKILFDFLGDFKRKLRVNLLEVKVTLAGDDPCDLAVNYGKTWTAVGNLIPALERWFVIKKRDVEVECDFTASEVKVIARLEITITLGRLLSLVAVYAVRGLKEFIVFQNKRKGGAAK